MSSGNIRKLLVTLLTTVMTIFLMVPAVFAAAPTLSNPGFETGNLSGWITQIPVGGTAEAVTSYNTKNAISGSYFALLKTDGPGSYTTISQSFTAQAGDTISGYAFFQSWDNGGYYNDRAMVRIMQDTTEVSTVFYSDSNTIGYSAATPWTLWSYTFSAAGTYTLQARVTNGGSGTWDSFMGLDIGIPIKHYKEFTGISGGGYFLDATAAPAVNKAFFELEANITEPGLDVDFSFTEDLFFNEAPVYIVADDVASWYEYFPAENKLSFKVPATITTPLLYGGEPFTRTIYITGKDSTPDTIWVTILNIDNLNLGHNVTYYEQPVAGGRIITHFEQVDF